MTFTSTASSNTSTSTNTTTEEPNNSFVSTSSVESFVEPEIEKNEIETESSTELAREEVSPATSAPEVELFDNSSLHEQELNQRLEESDEDHTDWSIVFIVAIIALVAAIVIAVILIVRELQE